MPIHQEQPMTFVDCVKGGVALQAGQEVSWDAAEQCGLRDDTNQDRSYVLISLVAWELV